MNDSPCKFSSLYKNNDQLVKKQQQRRNELLSNRLCKRDKLISSIRRLVSDVASDDEQQQQQQQPHESLPLGTTNTSTPSFITPANMFNVSNTNSMPPFNFQTPSPNSNAQQQSPQQHHHHNNIQNSPCSSTSSNKSTSIEDRKFRNKAMLSEWLVDRPIDFESEWVLKPTPVGRRCLVFSRKGATVAYSRTGQFIKAFQSALPGGCHMHISHCRRQYAIVDCIYVQQTNTFYLMDVLAWNQQKLYESDASMRFFWLQSRYNENQEKFLTTNAKNECRFYCLNTYTTSDQDIIEALNNDPLIKQHGLQLDGLLFFHVKGPYVPGANPLVLWIKPDMVSRVLNIS